MMCTRYAHTCVHTHVYTHIRTSAHDITEYSHHFHYTYPGALIAYVALKDVFSPLVYGICFGLISGMMVYIALKELLPTAYKFSGKHSHDVLVPIFLVGGMVVMAVSLLLLQV